MMQELIVALAVVVAAIYVVWMLVPVRARFSLLSRLDAALAQRGRFARWLRVGIIAPLLRRAVAGGGCASCGANPAASDRAPGQRRSP